MMPESTIEKNLCTMVKQFADVNLYQKFMMRW